MGLFRPYKRTEPVAEDPATPAAAASTPAGPVRKDTPTPTRREAEQARRERVNPTLTPKQAKAKQRQARYEQRESAMRVAEAQPGKVLMRDWVDSRPGMAQFSMPVLMSMLMVSLLVTGMGTTMVAIISYGTWIVMFGIFLDLYFMWRGYKKLHAERLPREPLKGLLSYGINRSINMRRLRMPKPRVKRGDPI